MKEDIGQVELRGALGLGFSHKKKVTETGTRHVTKITFEVEASPTNIARLMYFCKQDTPMDVKFLFPEAVYDFTMSPVKIATGEIAPDEVAKLM